MRWRKINYTFHSTVGLWLAVFLCVIALTGAALVIDPELDALANPQLEHPTAEAGRVTASEVEEMLRKETPEGALKGIHLPTESDKRYRAEIESEEGAATVFVSAESGKVIGRAEHPWRKAILNLHRSMWLGDWGRAAFFPVACGLVLLAGTGLWVHRKSWKAITHLPRFRRSLRLGFSDLHKSLGVLLFIFLVLIGATGAWLEVEAFGKIIEGKPALPAVSGEVDRYVKTGIAIEKALEISRGSIKGFEPGHIRFPKEKNGLLRVTGCVSGGSFYGALSTRVELDSESGNLLNVRDPRTSGWQVKGKIIAESLHYGRYGSFWVKLIYFLASLGLVVICIAGLGIWWSRRRH